jgi:hypothetical protein
MSSFSRQLFLGSIAVSAISVSAFANVPNLDNQNYFWPLLPRMTGMGLFGDDTTLSGDGMAAVWGNQNHILFVDAQAKTAFNTDWFGGIGAGFRNIINDQQILGGYVFVDRSVSPYNNEFWFISPGLETLGSVFDFHINGYFPTSNKKQYGITDWADNFGIYNYVWFQGHNQYDILMQQDEEVGWGADAELGTAIPGTRNTRFYVGGYHFNFDDASNINGVAGRLEIPINRYLALTARDSYDNLQHNTFMAGVKINLGGVNVHPRDPHQAIQERILDPIERNLATLGQGTAVPIQNVLTPVNIPVPPPTPVPPPSQLERNNIWFFTADPTATLTETTIDINSCTFEHPCTRSDFTQPTINSINSLAATDSRIAPILSTSPSFYLAPDHYDALNETSPLELNNDWIFGRTADFIAPLQLATLVGSLSFSGNNNLLDHMIVINSEPYPQPYGVLLHPDSSLLITHTRIGIGDPILVGTPLSGSYPTAIHMQDATLQISDQSEIFAQAENAAAIGIHAEDSQTTGSTIGIKDSFIQANSTIDTLPVDPIFLMAAGIRSNDTNGTGTTNVNISLSNTQIEVLGFAEVGDNLSQFIRITGIDAASPINSMDLPTSTVNIHLNNSSIFTHGVFNISHLLMETTAMAVGGSHQDIDLINHSSLTANDELGTGTSKFVAGLMLRTAGVANILLNNSTIETHLNNLQPEADSSSEFLTNSGIFINSQFDQVSINLLNESLIQANITSTITNPGGFYFANTYGIDWIGGFGKAGKAKVNDIPLKTFNVYMQDSSIETNTNIDTMLYQASQVVTDTAGILSPRSGTLNNFSLTMQNSSISSTQSFESSELLDTIGTNNIGVYADADIVNIEMNGESLINAATSFSLNTTDFFGGLLHSNISTTGLELSHPQGMSNTLVLNNSSEIKGMNNFSMEFGANVQSNEITTNAIYAEIAGTFSNTMELNDSSRLYASTLFNSQISTVLQDSPSINTNGLYIHSDTLDSMISLNNNSSIVANITFNNSVDGSPNGTAIANTTLKSKGIIFEANTATSNDLYLNDSSFIDVSTKTNALPNNILFDRTLGYAAGIVNLAPTLNVVTDNTDIVRIKVLSSLVGIFDAGGNTETAYGIDNIALSLNTNLNTAPNTNFDVIANTAGVGTKNQKDINP